MANKKESSIGPIVYLSFVDSGGMYHYAKNLAEAIKKTEECWLAIFSSGEKVEKCQSQLVILPKSKDYFRYILSQKYNASYYRKSAKYLFELSSPKLLHVISDGVGILSFLKKMRTLGVKIVYTVHDPQPHEESITLWSKLVRKYKKRYQFPQVFRLCDAIHVHSNKHASELCSVYGGWLSKKIYVVPHGAGLTPEIEKGNDFPPELRDFELNKAFVILFFGRIHPYKGIEYLLEAHRIIRKFGYKTKLIIAGEGEMPRCSTSLFEDCLVINRFIQDSEIRKIFECVNVVVLPYISGTQSGVIPLAYSFAKPVICTEVGAFEEAIIHGKTGFLVPPKSPYAIAEAIISMINEEKWLKMGKAGWRFARRTMTWEIIGERHRDNYNILITL